MIINTRPVEYADDMRQAVSMIGDAMIMCPLHAMTVVPWSYSHDTHADAVILTSRLAASIAAQRGVPRNLPVLAVGSATAASARQAGFHEIVDGGGTAERLLNIIDGASFERGLYLSARHVSRDLSLDRPQRIQRHIIYEMTPAEAMPDAVLQSFTSRADVTIPFYSPRALQAFEALVSRHGLNEHLKTATAVLIHSRLADHLTTEWRSIEIASSPDNAGMIQAMREAA